MEEEGRSGFQTQPHAQHLEPPKVGPAVRMKLNRSNIQHPHYLRTELV